MTIYLHDIPLPEAQERFEKALTNAGLDGILEKEEISLDETCLGRVLAKPVWAILSSPHYHASAMDGYAVRSEMIKSASSTTPVTLPCGPEAQYVDTGDPLPEWADAVIPIEDVEPLDRDGVVISASIRNPAAIRVRSSLAPWKYIRSLGEDIVATQLVLPQGHILRPVDLGAIAASGHHSVNVAKKPVVAILPTGSELIELGQPVKKGDIIEYNSIVIAAQVQSWGGSPKRLPISPDDFDAICRNVEEAANSCDLVLLNAGSSAGSEDFSARIIETLGEVLVHGIAVRPGHPVILGMLKRKKNKTDTVPVIGVPGYPVSAALTCEIFVEPLLAKWTGREKKKAETIKASITTKITSPAGDDDYVRVALGKVGEKILAAPIARGAGVITSLVQADGIVIIRRGLQGLSVGDEVEAILQRPTREIESTIFAIGSHDITLDILAQFLASHSRRLSSANVGSLAGLMALKNGQAHLTGSHLLDEETGEYNISFIRRYIPDIPLKLVALVGRQQGLIVQPGNPKNIRTLADLKRSGVRFINRQRGAGTRVLLDFELKKAAISAESIQGYYQEEFTHLNIAAAVSSHRADCGLGIAAAAHALGLDFIPLFQERYDLVFPKAYVETDLLLPIHTILFDKEFRSTVASLPGYDISPMGTIIYEQ